MAYRDSFPVKVLEERDQYTSCCAKCLSDVGCRRRAVFCDVCLDFFDSLPVMNVKQDGFLIKLYGFSCFYQELEGGFLGIGSCELFGTGGFKRVGIKGLADVLLSSPQVSGKLWGMFRTSNEVAGTDKP